MSAVDHTLQQRTVVVRESDGVLRFATPEERDRTLQVYFPRPGKMYAMPKMFTEDLLEVRHISVFFQPSICDSFHH